MKARPIRHGQVGRSVVLAFTVQSAANHYPRVALGF